jgi:hypothetical protein
MKALIIPLLLLLAASCTGDSQPEVTVTPYYPTVYPGCWEGTDCELLWDSQTVDYIDCKHRSRLTGKDWTQIEACVEGLDRLETLNECCPGWHAPGWPAIQIKADLWQVP